jgi:hypothetical protein
MADLKILTNLRRELTAMTIPSVTQWNRVEGRPRTTAFDQALRAEVRDGLWMLARQWQMGEFRGDDAGAPVLAQMRMDHTRLTKAKLGEDPVEPMNDPLPLEARVERLQAQFVRGGRKIAYDLRLLMGRHWLKTISGIGNHAQAFRDAYPILPPDPTSTADADICAHPASFATLSAVAGRAMDGGELYLHLKEAGAVASDGVAVGGDAAAINTQGDKFVLWFERLISQPPPDHDGAWTPDRLEYQFQCSSPTSEQSAKVYTATEFYSGRLDWWALDIDPSRTTLEEPDEGDPNPAEDATVMGAEMRTVIPTPLSYDGMPNARWWSFEDGKVNFGAVSAATTDLAKLLFLEFALVYSNNWFLAPFTAPAGTIATLRGCAVTNTFGERFWILPAAQGLDDDPRRFTLFTSSVLGEARLPADTSLLLLPTAPNVLDGPRLEEVVFLRDEMANMVWGVEKVVSLPDGTTKPGLEVGRETRGYFERLLAADPDAEIPSAADIRYRVMTTVPENWIPFIPAHDPGSDRTVRLQRAAMPRVMEGDPDDPKRIPPQTMLLRDGLDVVDKHPYFLHEEEVPREGVQVIKSFQRTRWRDGRVVVWMAVRKVTGRGEGSSGLGFDRIAPTPRDTKPPA